MNIVKIDYSTFEWIGKRWNESKLVQFIKDLLGEVGIEIYTKTEMEDAIELAREEGYGEGYQVGQEDIGDYDRGYDDGIEEGYKRCEHEKKSKKTSAEFREIEIIKSKGLPKISEDDIINWKIDSRAF